MLIPGQPVPSLVVDTLAHGSFDLSSDHGGNGTLLFFYRGLHCPICIGQMKVFEEMQDRITGLGLAGAMISTNDADMARQAAERAGVAKARIGYGLGLRAARDDWKMLISEGAGTETEAAFYTEPATYLVKADGSLYVSWLQSVPFARPTVEMIVEGLEARLPKGYPVRGTYTGPLEG